MDSDTLARIEAAARRCPQRDRWYDATSPFVSNLPSDDRAYIATMDPATTLALVEHVRRLERAVEYLDECEPHAIAATICPAVRKMILNGDNP